MTPLVATDTELEMVMVEALSWPERARQLVILTDGDYEHAGELLHGIKDLRREVDATFDGIIAKAYSAHKEAVGQKKKAEAPLLEAEGILKRGLCAYDTAREAERQAEERRLQEVARQDAERRQLEEAAALELQGHANADPELLWEALQLLEQPVQAPVVLLERTTPKVNGLSYRDVWSARVTNLPALIRYVAANPGHAGLLLANGPALNGLARSLKGGMQIPGVEAVCQKTAAAGGRG